MKRILYRLLSNSSIESYQSVIYCTFKNHAFLEVALLEIPDIENVITFSKKGWTC